MKRSTNKRLTQKARLNPLPEGYRWLRVAQEMHVYNKNTPTMYVCLKGTYRGCIYRQGDPWPMSNWKVVAKFDDVEDAFTFMSNTLLFGDT